MQKKNIKVMLYSIFILSLFSMALLALADDDNVANVLEAKKTALENSARDHLLKMDATISVADKQTLNTTELVITRGNFNEVIDKIDAAKSEEELKSIREQLVNLAKDLKKQAKSAAVDVYKSEVKKETEKKIEENKNATNKYKEEALEARRTAILRLFDNHVDKAQEAIDRLKLRNVNTAEVEGKLSEFKNLKPEIVSALASNNKDQVRETMRKVQLNWNQLRKAFREATKGKQIGEALDRADKIVERVQRNIDRMKEKDISTTALETKLSTIKTKISDARNALQLANYDAAEVIQKQIKNAYIDIKQSQQDVVDKFGTKEKKFTNDDIKGSMEKKDKSVGKGEAR